MARPCFWMICGDTAVMQGLVYNLGKALEQEKILNEMCDELTAAMDRIVAALS